jgi:hypothetical protein
MSPCAIGAASLQKLDPLTDERVKGRIDCLGRIITMLHEAAPRRVI